MLTDSVAIVDGYWASDLGCDPSDLRPNAPRVQCHAGGLKDYSGVFIFVLEAPVVSVPDWLFDELAPRASEFQAATVRDPEALRRLLQPASITRIAGPALLNYVDRTSFAGSVAED